MMVAEKEVLIAKYEEGARAFDDTLAFPPAVLTFRPTVDSWTIHEHVVHFVESDVAAFHRYRKAVAEPGGAVVGYDEEIWTATLNYHAVALKDVLALLKLIRKIGSAHLRSIVTRDWTVSNFVHSTKGLINLEEWLADYVDHIRFHREYIHRNQTLFAKRGQQ